MSKIIRLSDCCNAVTECAAWLDQGGVVALPTETVYGLVCRHDRFGAAEKLFEIKNRPVDKPFALFVQSFETARAWIEPNPVAETLAKAFWPGPLTLVVASHNSCPAAYDGAVGLRCPDHAFVQQLLEHCGGALVNTSLNFSGKPPATRIDETHPIIQRVDIAVDAGELPPQSPSAVVDCRTSPPQILRPGTISYSDILDAL
ncbi:MAG: L-threonylcarbamoyladenylate synthase [Candidatus Hinthialibacter antarcticus]|nr:L-threonylcarbamoyladenylate synthase [Candidatus Hinthialibacter antarcticus]